MPRDLERGGVHGFPEERAPCGRAGMVAWLGNILFPYREPPPLDAVLAAPVAGRPWFLVLWEPLAAEIPGPVTAAPWCCYINSVIFYAIGADGTYIAEDAEGRVVARGGRAAHRFREHAHVEYALYGDDVFAYGSDRFVLAGGRVCWRAQGDAPPRWWVLHRARRIHRDDVTLAARADEAAAIVRTMAAANASAAAAVARFGA